MSKMKKKDTKILLVDDEPDILEIVGYNLSSIKVIKFLQQKTERKQFRQAEKHNATSNNFRCNDACNGWSGSL